jgi:hypothetical protein
MRSEKHARDVNVTGDTMVIDESEDDDDISAVADDLSRAVTHCGRVFITLASSPRPHTQRLSSASSTKQASFEDLGWKTWKLETEDEKRSQWKKDAKEMQEEQNNDRMQGIAKEMDRKQQTKDLAWDHQ